jgi:hypothetical protein
MYDMHQKMNTFYHTHVRLPQAKREELGGYRDLNLERLNEGLALIGEEDDTTYAQPITHCDQGSYAMHTLNQNPANEYDIDEAIIFRKEDLPADPCDARRRIERAFRKVGGNFKIPPEARTNAVTVWYAEGYHVDFAVYRRTVNGWGQEITEHAGPEWKVRSAQEITDWFTRQVNQRSPRRDLGATVEAGQFRKVVRLLKAFARSRPEWNLPGGIIISKLVDECYQQDASRDDRALYLTAKAVRTRLLDNTTVLDPIHPEQQLTDKQAHVKQVERLCAQLGQALEELAVLWREDCTQNQALAAWHWFFNHDFWLPDSGEESTAKVSAVRRSLPDVRESQPFG